MFLGEYQAELDEKRRLYLPKKVRQILTTQKVVLTRGYENCIFGWNLPDWESSNKSYLEKPLTDLEARNVRRYLFSGAQISDLDRLGRIVIPENLAVYGNIASPVTLIGAGDHFEIWSSLHWNEYLTYLERE